MTSVGTDVEVAVVGGGIMGACAAWRLAGRGRDVHLLEQFGRGHEHGSSHGTARIFRLAYPESDYVALARASLPLWGELEAASGRELRARVGALDHGDPAEVDRIVANLVAAGIDHQRLTPADVGARWPGLRCDRSAVFHPDGGTVNATASVLAATDVAVSLGATVREQCVVQRLEARDDHVVVHTVAGRMTARRVVVAAGAWTGGLLEPGLLPPLVVTREQPVHFERVTDGGEVAGGEPWPSFLHWSDAGPAKTSGVDEKVWGYGLPSPDGRIKVGEHHTGEVVARSVPAGKAGSSDVRAGLPVVPPSPDPTPVDEASLARVEAYVRDWVPAVDPASAEPERCLYTSTPTTDFVVDAVGPIVVAAGFSGHGFKFAPRIGELLADMVDGAPSPSPRFHRTR